MPKYKNKVGKIIELPKLSGKEARALGLRSVITVKDIEDAGKKKKQVGGIINREGFAVRGGIERDSKRRAKAKRPTKLGMRKPKYVGRKAEEMKKKMSGKGNATKTTAMRGGGLARSGSASLSGYKVR